MSERLHIDDGLIHLQIGEEQVNIDPIVALQKINEITDRHTESKNFEHLAEFAAWFQQFAAIDITLSQAEKIMRTIQIEYARAQNDFFTTLKSLRPTDSTPADLTGEGS